MQFKSSLFFYNTSVAWDTFMAKQSVTATVVAGLQIGLLFLALAGIEAAHPQALDWLRREGRARFGRPALVAALTALGILVIQRVGLQWIANAFPTIASAGGLDVPQAVNMAAPSLMAIGEAIVRAIEVSAAVALFIIGVRATPGAGRYADLIAVVAIFFVILDPNAHGPQAVFALLSAAIATLLAWLMVRFVLADNLLAYPLATALAILIGTAATMLQNHRNDLIVNGIIVIAAAVALMIWIAAHGPRTADHAENA